MITPRYPSAGTTIFTVMSALAQEHKAINLSQGFPDFAIDPEWESLVSAAIREGYNQYAPMAGLLLLRQAISHKIQAFQDVAVDAETEITITPGATYGIYTALTTILEPGDEVIVLEPAYDSYIPNIYMSGGRPVCIALDEQNGFAVNWEKVFAAANTRTKAIIINNPHNPSGAVWAVDDYQNLQRLVQQYNLFVIADEVYEHLVYDNNPHISLLRFPGLRSRSFVIFSFGKTLHATGWKLGYVVAPEPLTAAFRQIHQYLAFSVNTPMQQAITTYLLQQQKLEEGRALLEQKRNFFLEGMKGTRFVCPYVARGSYFQVMDYSGISELPDKEFAIWLTRQHGVAVIPVSSFYSGGSDHKLVRFCFAKRQETLQLAIDKLMTL